VRLRTIKFFLRHKSSQNPFVALLPVDTKGARRGGLQPQNLRIAAAS
jgi:hypothetical protein